jgi:hypothetical protein
MRDIWTFRIDVIIQVVGLLSAAYAGLIFELAVWMHSKFKRLFGVGVEG